MIVKVANNHKYYKDFLQHFTNHFTGELTCEQCNVTFTRKCGLKINLLIHESKRQFKCPQDECDRTFNTKHRLKEYEVVHLKNKLFRCNYCFHKTDRR